MDVVSVYVEVEINPTESEEKVRQAVENIFGKLVTQTQSLGRVIMLRGRAEGIEVLTKLCNLLRRQRIRAAARKEFFQGMSGKTVDFCLNKQVAFAGHVSFSKESGESPLGPIRVRIETENPRELIDWLAPRVT
jgi:predicted RNA binding protein with dsRBD fold (UPF0201 family)